MGEGNRGGRASAALFVTQLIVAALSLPVTILLAHLLGPSGLGEYQLLNRVALIAVSVLCFGFPHAVAWLAGQQTDGLKWDRAIVRLTLWVSAVGGALGAAVAVLVWAMGYRPIDAIAWLFLGSFPLLNLVSANLVNFARGRLDSLGIAVIKLSQVITWAALLGIIWGIGQLDVPTAVIASTVSQGVSVIAGLLRLASQHRLVGDAERLDLRTVLRFAFGAYPGLAIRDLNVYLDQPVVGAFLGTTQLGHYAVSASLSSALGLFTGPIVNTVQPTVQAAQPDVRGRAIAQSLAATLWIAGIPAIVLAGLSPWIVPLFYGPAFGESVPLVMVLCGGVVLDALTLCCHGILLGLGNPGRSSASAALGLAAEAILWVILLPTMGVMGAAIVSVLAYFIVLIFMTFGVALALKTHTWSLWHDVFAIAPHTFGRLVHHGLGLLRRVT